MHCVDLMSTTDSINQGKKTNSKDVAIGVKLVHPRQQMTKQQIKRSNKIAPNMRKILAGVNISCDNAHSQLAERSTYIVNSYVNLIHLRVVMGALSSETSTQDQQADQRLHDLYSMLNEHTACGLPPRLKNMSNGST